MSRAALAAFVAGAAVMALEILASRWMAPGLGFTLSTWAWLISVTLLAGAGGAALGGRLARAPRWSRAASLLIAAGAWAAALAFGAPAFVDALDAVDPELGAALAALLLVGPPVLVLGGVLPLATALAKETQPVGPTVGRLIAVSTLGSLAGTLLAAFLFVPHLGLEAGALVLAGVLVGVGLLLCAQRGAGLAALVIGCAASALTPSTPSGAAIERQTPYGLLTLSRAPHAGWTLAIDGIAQASVSPSAAGPGALLAHRQYTELLPYFRPLGTRALQVGLGGGLVANTLAAYGIEVETIEVNPGLVDVMRERFGYDGVVHVGDGRAVWRRLDRSYDFVVLDAFQGESLPAHLLTREAFVELHGMLEPGGVVCVHLIGTPAHDAVAAVASTMRSVFAHVRAVRSGAGDELQDLFLFASTRTLEVPPLRVLRRAGWLGNEWFEPNEKGAAVLTDDRNPLDVLGEPLARALRRASRTR